jgi:hypothetical protein
VEEGAEDKKVLGSVVVKCPPDNLCRSISAVSFG